MQYEQCCTIVEWNTHTAIPQWSAVHEPCGQSQSNLHRTSKIKWKTTGGLGMNCDHLTIADLSPPHIANQMIGTSSGLCDSITFQRPYQCVLHCCHLWCVVQHCMGSFARLNTNTGAQIALRSKLELRATPPPHSLLTAWPNMGILHC